MAKWVQFLRRNTPGPNLHVIYFYVFKKSPVFLSAVINGFGSISSEIHEPMGGGGEGREKVALQENFPWRKIAHKERARVDCRDFFFDSDGLDEVFNYRRAIITIMEIKKLLCRRLCPRNYSVPSAASLGHQKNSLRTAGIYQLLPRVRNASQAPEVICVLSCG